VFGESAAFGDPQPEFGMSRILETLLNARFPDRHFEVINTAMTAINSHVILPIARDSAKQHGDFWVLYIGNNEVVGPYGAGTVFGAKAPSLAMVRAAVAFKSTRIGQAFGTLARRAQNRTANDSEWGGMKMFEQNHVRQDDPRMATVYNSFEKNLADIISIGARSGAKVVVSTVARNLKDCGPFASDHKPGLSAKDLAHWENFYEEGIRAQQEKRIADAISNYQQALKIDDTFAEIHFRLGQCLLLAGQSADAKQQFELACDDDTLRFRADDRINKIIRDVAANSKTAGVQLVDSDAAICAQSPNEISGEEFLYEHVHLNFKGNYAVARVLAESVGNAFTGGDTHPWLTADQCADRLGWNDFTRRKADMEILSRLSNPPFNEQANHREIYERLVHQIEQLQPAMLPDALRQDESRTKTAADAAPNDWILQRNLAILQQQTGDNADAIESLHRVVNLQPQNPDNWQAWGLGLEATKRDDEAVAAFQEAARLHPESVVSLNSLAELYARENKTNQAAAEFQEVLRRKPYWGPAHLGLGKELELIGKTNEANHEFEEALRNRIISPESFNALAKFSFLRGWYAAAVTNYSDSLKLYPSDPETHVNLGLALDKLGRRTEAKEHYQEAIRLKPNLAEAHFCLGLEFGQDGDATGAAAQFSETVRLKPELIEARLNLGIALANEQHNRQAMEQFNEVLRRDPNNPIALSQIKKISSHSDKPTNQ
jgi:tetratricopeptide (TPR) repeat protein